MPVRIIESTYDQEDHEVLAQAIRDLEHDGQRYVSHEYFKVAPIARFVIITEESRGKVERRTRSEQT